MPKKQLIIFFDSSDHSQNSETIALATIFNKITPAASNLRQVTEVVNDVNKMISAQDNVELILFAEGDAARFAFEICLQLSDVSEEKLSTYLSVIDPSTEASQLAHFAYMTICYNIKKIQLLYSSEQGCNKLEKSILPVLPSRTEKTIDAIPGVPGLALFIDKKQVNATDQGAIRFQQIYGFLHQQCGLNFDLTQLNLAENLTSIVELQAAMDRELNNVQAGNRLLHLDNGVTRVQSADYINRYHYNLSFGDEAVATFAYALKNIAPTLENTYKIIQREALMQSSTYNKIDAMLAPHTAKINNQLGLQIPEDAKQRAEYVNSTAENLTYTAQALLATPAAQNVISSIFSTFNNAQTNNGENTTSSVPVPATNNSNTSETSGTSEADSTTSQSENWDWSKLTF